MKILSATVEGTRIGSIDVVRGLVMVIMALDHVRDLIHADSLTKDPADLATTTPALFLTRWITHLCAPAFVFLSGVSVYLSSRRVPDLGKSGRFLLTRGIWLFILEFTVVNFGIWFDIRFSVLLFQVIAAIGLGLVVLGLTIHASPRILGWIGLAIVCLHNVLPAGMLGPLFSVNALPISPHTTLVIGYPPVPWIAVMLLGYWLGSFLGDGQNQRSKLFLKLGCISLVAFFCLRLVNCYGDPVPWSAQPDPVYSVLSFINVAKYPPSLLYCLLMLGIMFLLLSAAEHLSGRFTDTLRTFGSVPLFFYLIHWYIIHLTLFGVLLIQGFGISDFVFGFRFGRPEGESGLDLAGIYLVWTALILVLYPVCVWYANYKSAHRTKRWLRFF